MMGSDDLPVALSSDDARKKSCRRNAKARIKSAFLELFDSTSYEKINVALICERACVSRKTFYYHFANKDDLVRWICRSDLEDFVDSRTDDGASAFVNLVDFFIKSNRRLYGFALQDMSPGSFGQFFSDLLYCFTSARLRRFYMESIGDKSAVSLAIALDVERGRLLCVFWLLSPREPSADELMTFIYEQQAAYIQVLGRWVKKMDNRPFSPKHIVPVFSESDYLAKMVHSFDLKSAFDIVSKAEPGTCGVEDRMEIEKWFLRYR